MNHHDVMDMNARSMPKKGKPELKSMEHERSANGGHVFTHRMMNDGGMYHEPETHTFGADEDDKVMAHFAKHAGLSDSVKPDKDSAAGAAT